MKLRISLFIIIIFLQTELFGFVSDSIVTGGVGLISKSQLKNHIDSLGSDLFEGRSMGTSGGNLAAKYLASQFEKMNLIPAGDEGTYYQYIPMHASQPQPESGLVLYHDKDSSLLMLNQDYLLYKTGEQTFIPNPLPLVFVGFGIVAPEFDYNDYQSVNVENKIVVFLEGEPFSTDEKYFEGIKPSIYSLPEMKQRIAISRGASGSIMIPGIRYKEAGEWKKLINEFAFEDVTLAYSASGNLSVLMGPYVAEQLFHSAEFSINEVFNMQQQNSLKSFELQTKISFKGEFRERDFTSANIVGMIKGSNEKLSDSYLLISAHYDHLGIGPAVDGDSIYNGVYDNAIGVASLLEIASAFSKPENKPERSIVFLLTAGEEKGWLGSTYYVNNPVVPLYKTIANVNIDGIALFDRFRSIVGVGREYSSLNDFLIEIAKRNNLEVEDIPEQFIQSESFTRSDQIIFAQAGIPSILISEGLNYENLSREDGIRLFIHYSENVYHTPFDDLTQPMNFDAAEQHTKIIFEFCRLLAASESVPEWNEGVPYNSARLRSIAERK
ncbi:MAG: M28 family peptidase [Ignavibacteriales bacterium]|nr:MAG: M28 family peptidase [Ignavibacteriales bacterium]